MIHSVAILVKNKSNLHQETHCHSGNDGDKKKKRENFQNLVGSKKITRNLHIKIKYKNYR